MFQELRQIHLKFILLYAVVVCIAEGRGNTNGSGSLRRKLIPSLNQDGVTSLMAIEPATAGGTFDEVVIKIGMVAAETESFGSKRQAFTKSIIELIQQCGGEVIMIPSSSSWESIQRTFLPIHGLFLDQGSDLSTEVFPDAYDHKNGYDPLSYQKKHVTPPLYGTDIQRDEVEKWLLNWITERGFPVFGICRGAELLNVYLGGNLIFDLESQKPNSIRHIERLEDGKPAPTKHEVIVIPRTPLYKWTKNKTMIPAVVSMHHQAISTLAEGLKMMAESDDGVVEGYYRDYAPDEGKLVAALQFHPEVNVDDGIAKAAIEDFVTAAKVRAKSEEKLKPIRPAVPH